MVEPPSLEELARRYMDLWEEQLTAVAGDQALADQMGKLFEAMRQGAGAIIPASGDPGAGTTDEAADDAKGQPADNPTGAATAGVASERGDGDMAEFVRRLTTVEKRLAALERKAGGKGRATAPRGGAKRGD
ncbi:MAG: hypothetical protein ACTSX7_20590 [Alphaproteobacteria bacterium]